MLCLATTGLGGGGGDTMLYNISNVTAVPVLATILHTGPLKSADRWSKHHGAIIRWTGDTQSPSAMHLGLGPQSHHLERTPESRGGTTGELALVL